MYVCICHAVNEKQIRRAVEHGVRDYSTLSAELGVGTACGRCRDCACEVLAEALEADRDEDVGTATSLVSFAL